ncbi:MAG: alpha/beta fold hydrolase [Bacillota bacterium]
MERVILPCLNGVSLPCLYLNSGAPLDVIFLHGLGENKEKAAAYLGNSGRFNVLMPDLPLHGERSLGSSIYRLVFRPELVADALRQVGQDVLACLEFLRRLSDNPIALAGYSLGGLITCALFGRYRELFCTGAAVAGGGDFAGLMQLHLPGPVFSKLYSRVRSLLDEWEPLNFANRFSDFLMVNGTEDTVIPFRHAEQLYHALETSSNRLLPIEGAGHHLPAELVQLAVSNHLLAHI